MILDKKMGARLTAALLLTAWILPLIQTNPTYAQSSSTKLKVLPATNRFYANVTLPGSTFTVNVTVVDVVDLQNWQIKLTWDPALLTYVSISLPPDHVFAGSGKAMITPPPEVGPGYVIWGCTYINSPYWTFNGTGTLCQVKLKILAPPTFPATCNLTFTEIGYNTFLINGPGYDIPFTVEPATYTYIDELKVTLSPPGPVIVDPGGMVTFTATAKNGPTPYKYQWFFRYPNGTEIEYKSAENSTSWTTPSITLLGDHKVTVKVTDRANAKANATAIVRRTGGPVVYVDPRSIVDPRLTPGKLFNISLLIRDAVTLHSWSAALFFNRTLLSATEVYEGDFLSSTGPTSFTFTIENNYNATHGRVLMNCQLLSPSDIAEGNGKLAIVTFNVSDLGWTTLKLANVDLRDPLGNSVPATSEDGYFNNVLLAVLAIDPSEVSGPEYLPGTTFTINVTVDDVENLKTCIFNLTYIPSVILEINVAALPVPGQTPIKKILIDDEAGYIWANITYRQGITTYEPLAIMRVEFTVVALGVSPINLTDTLLKNINNEPITHEVHHGIFIGLIRDVAITALSTDLNIAYQGWIVNINVTVKNEGNITETFEVKIYYDSSLGPTVTVSDLAPNEEITITINWNTKNVPYCHNYTISATAGPVPYEFDLSDNNFTDGKVKIRIMGDVNGDGIVDMRDINEVCSRYGAKPGDPKWEYFYDLNRDGRIDLRDIGLCCTNFMKSC